MLALRRARGTTGLLLAAAAATLVATSALTALAGYHRDVVDSGTRTVLAAATAEDRSLLVRGPAGRTVDTLDQRDRALRDGVADTLDGWPATVTTAGYAAGRHLRGDTGTAVPDDDGVVYASVMFLDDLAAHARLTAGTWPGTGTGTTTVAGTLPDAVAGTLGVTVGDRIPVTDGFTGRVTDVTVVGLWQPRDPGDTYWRLAPDATGGRRPATATYGPLTVDRAAFGRHFLTNASAGWLVEPDVTGGTGRLDRLAAAARTATTALPQAAGLGDSGTATTGLPALVDRIQRATLVGRSALVTPMLLVAVLAGYTLLLVAVLLTEHRRGETALLRARGAARTQLAALATREAALVVAPAVLLAPPLATAALRQADRIPALSAVSLRLDPRLDALTWAVTVVVAAGCAVAMLAPNLRRGASYVADQASRSRPGRRGAAQRAGVDVVLVVVALLGWYQLRSYASPLTGGTGGDLGIDPLLAAAPTLGVLAGAVLALRLLPPVTRLAERGVDRWTAPLLGVWQAGRRPHAGPVLLVALAVAVSALGWSLAGTTGRSLTDQADHQVGADLRLTEQRRDAPAQRAGQLAGLPGVTAVLPTWRDTLSLGPDSVPASLVAADAGTAGHVMRIRPDLTGPPPAQVFDTLTRARPVSGHTTLPAGARRLAGTWTATVTATDTPAPVRAWAVLTTPDGGHHRLPLGTGGSGQDVGFTVDLPADDPPARLAGFTVDTVGRTGTVVDWRLRNLRADDSTPVDLGGGTWHTVDRGGSPPDATATARAGTLTARYVRTDRSDSTARTGRGGQGIQLAVTRATTGAVPLLLTPAALAALRLDVGAQTRLYLGAAEVDVRVVDSIDALPGDTQAAAVFADLPALRDRLFADRGLLRANQEWWLTVDPRQPDTAATAATGLGGLDVHDRRAVARDLADDPFGVGARTALFAAALGAVLLAGVGITVDVNATARRRAGELAVLHTLGASHRTVTRSLVTEQAFLAGTGVLVGVAVGVAVAATMAPLVILTPAAGRPTPTPVLLIDWPPLLATAAGVLALALAATAVTAARLRGRPEAGRLRGGEDR
ncbi:FtsX-like permease family protein [Micromonospora cathayae]|uniref:FtsX-like permease family protein n=1 Tax=Micromonospora cathayae TaxID=3028804 RepID=A0ABY7ZM24_9ACTN|nr:FtsX-like permease family protein [Micromonospora sp. HUAS 3]WDZ83138.1 FtsX-like permease family protein [Micromonospora sp. HUAS 3]